MSYQIVPGPPEYVILRPREPVPGPEATAALDRAVGLATGFPHGRVLVDVRSMVGLPSASDTREFGRRLGAAPGLEFTRMALVARPGVHYGVARSIALLASSHGRMVEAFTTIGEAEAWLVDPGGDLRPPTGPHHFR